MSLPRRNRAGRRGAVALEYVLLLALIAVAMILSFRQWGQHAAKQMKLVAVDSESTTDGGAGGDPWMDNTGALRSP